MDADDKWEVDLVWIFVDRKLIKYKPVAGFHFAIARTGGLKRREILVRNGLEWVVCHRTHTGI